jgi:hypothetical protein
MFDKYSRLVEKYKDEPWVLSGKEVDDKIRSVFFSGKWGKLNYLHNTPKFGLKSGVVLDNWDTLHFLVDNEKEVGRTFKSLYEIKEIFHIHNSTSIKRPVEYCRTSSNNCRCNSASLSIR